MPSTRAKSKARKKSPAKKPKKSVKKKTPAKAKRTKTPKKKKTVTPTPPPPSDTPQQFEIDLILEMRKNSKRQEEFLVSWVGYPEEDNTWELGKDLKQDGHGDVVKAFKKELKKSGGAKKKKTPTPKTVVKKEEEEAETKSASTPAKLTVIETDDSSSSSSSNAPSTAGSYAFFWAVLLGSILLHFIIVILYEQADRSPVGQSPEAQYKWKNFLNQAKHWIGVLPPFMSLTVLVSHPAATAPFPKYVTVGLLWIATSTLLQNFNGLFGHEVQSMESINVLVTFTNVISYIFLANGFSGIRSVSMEKAPANYVWGALWISMFAWEFTIRMENGDYGTMPSDGNFVDNMKHLFVNERIFSPKIENVGMLLSIARLGLLYYATWRSSACVGHECSIYSHDAVPQHLGLIAMLLMVFANMWGILNFHLDKISWLGIQSINQQQWFDDELQNVIVWVGAGLLTTVGLMEADASN